MAKQNRFKTAIENAQAQNGTAVAAPVNRIAQVDAPAAPAPEPRKPMEWSAGAQTGFVTLTIAAPDGQVLGRLRADARTFSTGSRGFYAAGKITGREPGQRYQVSGNIVLIGSKPSR